MTKAFPFAYLLADVADVPAGFEFWLRSFAHPPIRTTSALFEHCPRIDWLIWVVGKAVAEGELPKTVLEQVATIAEPYLAQLTGVAERRDEYPTYEGLRHMRPVLAAACQEERLA